MVILGVLLLVLVVVVVAFVIITGSNSTVALSWDALNIQWNPTPALLFGMGALTLAVLGVSLLLMRSGVRHRVHSSQEMRRLRKLERQTGGQAPVPARHTDGRRETVADGSGATPADTGHSRADVTDRTRSDPAHRSDDWDAPGPGATRSGSAGTTPPDRGGSPSGHDGR